MVRSGLHACFDFRPSKCTARATHRLTASPGLAPSTCLADRTNEIEMRWYLSQPYSSVSLRNVGRGNWNVWQRHGQKGLVYVERKSTLDVRQHRGVIQGEQASR